MLDRFPINLICPIDREAQMTLALPVLVSDQTDSIWSETAPIACPLLLNHSRFIVAATPRHADRQEWQ